MKKLKKSLITLTESTYGIRDLRECLNFYWNKENRKALTFLSSFLSERPNHQMKFSLYRLWIEISEAENDLTSLRGLSEHFMIMAVEHKEDADAFSGLKGLCHLLLDEVEACELFASLLKNSKNPFALEFVQLFERRSGKASMPLLSARGCLLDYFHLQTLATDFSKLSRTGNSLGAIVSYTESLYQGCPLSDLMSIHLAVSEGNDQQAYQISAALCRKFPKNKNYQNLNLVLDAMRFNWADVQARLTKEEFSFESLALAEWGSKLGQGDQAKWDHILKDLYKKGGVDFIAHNRHESQRKPWIAFADNQTWNKFSDRLEDGIELDLPHQVYEGDWVFLARPVSSSADKNCRVFGIFQATWCGGLGIQALGSRYLEPVLVFERSCLVELNHNENDLHKQFGLSTLQVLESQDLDLIASAMSDQLLYSSDLINDLVVNLSA